MLPITYAALATAALLVATSTARATPLTGNELLKFCEDRGGAGYTACLGYVTGVADLSTVLTMKMVTMIDDDGDDGMRFVAWCRPEGVTNSQLVDVVVPRAAPLPGARSDHASVQDQLSLPPLTDANRSSSHGHPAWDPFLVRLASPRAVQGGRSALAGCLSVPAAAHRALAGHRASAAVAPPVPGCILGLVAGPAGRDRLGEP
jgi:hypothetical protein